MDRRSFLVGGAAALGATAVNLPVPAGPVGLHEIASKVAVDPARTQTVMRYVMVIPRDDDGGAVWDDAKMYPADENGQPSGEPFMARDRKGPFKVADMQWDDPKDMSYAT